MNIDREQIKAFGEMPTRKVYTLQEKNGGQVFGTLVTPHIEQVLELFSNKLLEAGKLGNYVEITCDSNKTSLGKRILHQFRVTEAQSNTWREWSILVEET